MTPETADCPSEETWSIYIDRELPEVTHHAAEAHLVVCRSCRERVLALEDEAAWLGSVLREESLPTSTPAKRARSRSVWVGFVPAVVGMALVFGAVGALIESRLPTGLSWMNPLDWVGVFDMVFDTLFLLRDRAPAYYQLAVSSAALLSVAFLLTTGFTVLTRKITRTDVERFGSILMAVGLGLAMQVAWPDPASAFELDVHAEHFEVPAEEVREDTVFFSGESIEIAGTLRGDLVVFAERLAITGEVEGNVYGLVRDIEVSGRVGGTMIAIADRVRQSGEVAGNAVVLTEHYDQGAESRVGQDAFCFGEWIELRGETGRDLVVRAERMELRGRVGRNMDVGGDELTVFDTARIGGDLVAHRAPHEDPIEVSDRAVIGGELRDVEGDHFERDALSRFGEAHFYVLLVLSFGAAFLVGMVLFYFAPWLFGGRLESSGDVFRALGWGFVALAVVPLGLIVLGLTLVGLPLALIGVAGFLTAVYGAKIVVAGVLGMALVGVPREGDWSGFALPLLAGLGVVVIGTHLPYLGGVLGFIVLLTGLGMLVDRTRARFFLV